MIAGLRTPPRQAGVAAVIAEAHRLDLRPARQRQEHDVGSCRDVVERGRALRLGAVERGERGGVVSNAMTSPPCLSAMLRHIGPPMTPRPTKPMTGVFPPWPPQSIHMPPLMSSDVPVIQFDAGEHRNSAACAMSSALP